MSEDIPLEAKAEQLEDALRAIGLHVERSTWMPQASEEEPGPFGGTPGRQVLLVSALLGDLAFSKRVQDPEQFDMDAAFSEMTRSFDASEIEELREQTRRRIAEGKDPLGED